MFSSREEAERLTPYVLVSFETHDNRTFASIVKSFSCKRTADNYVAKNGYNCCEVMTRNKYKKEASMCM